MTKRTTRLAAVVLACGVGLTACGSPQDEDKQKFYDTTLDEQHHKLSDGRTVTCITYKHGYAGGLSCDWDNAR